MQSLYNLSKPRATESTFMKSTAHVACWLTRHTVYPSPICENIMHTILMGDTRTIPPHVHTATTTFCHTVKPSACLTSYQQQQTGHLPSTSPVLQAIQMLRRVLQQIVMVVQQRADRLANDAERQPEEHVPNHLILCTLLQEGCNKHHW